MISDDDNDEIGVGSEGGTDTGETPGDAGSTGGGGEHPPTPSTCLVWYRVYVDGALVIREVGDHLEVLQRRDCMAYDENGHIIFEERWVTLPITDVIISVDEEIRRLVPRPQVTTAPPLEAMIVNLPARIAATPPDEEIAVRLPLPLGNWIEARATPVLMTWHTGSKVPGDVTHVECLPWGDATRDGGCTWTPAHPSTAAATGTTDNRYHGSMTILWSVTWTTSLGGGGTLDDIETSTPVLIAVREIQVIGGRV